MNSSVQIAIGATSGRSYGPLLTVFLVLLLACSGWFWLSLSAAPEAMPWGSIVATYIYLLGVTQFGVVFAAILRISRTKWGRPFYRLGELVTLSFFPFAIGVFLIIYVFGREEIFYWISAGPEEHLSPWLNADFLLVRNLAAQLIFYALAAVYFIIGLLPDVTPQSAESGPGWRRRFYRGLLKLKRGKDERRLQSLMYLLAPVVIIVCGITNTLISWDFGMMLVPHYHSTVFPMYFIMGIMVSGTGAMLILGAFMSRVVGLSEYFGKTQVKSLGMLITAFVLFWLYMFWAQFFVTWFGNLPPETGPLWKQMYGHYAPLFWAQMICIIGIPIAALIFAAVKRAWWSMILLGVIINAGIWINRYLIVVPALEEAHIPFSSLMEIVFTVGLFAGFLTILLLLFRMFPMISSWEMRDAEDSNPVY